MGEGAYGVVLKCRHKETDEVSIETHTSAKILILTLDCGYKKVQRS